MGTEWHVIRMSQWRTGLPKTFVSFGASTGKKWTHLDRQSGQF
jgi:hypothetical protein